MACIRSSHMHMRPGPVSAILAGLVHTPLSHIGGIHAAGRAQKELATVYRVRRQSPLAAAGESCYSCSHKPFSADQVSIVIQAVASELVFKNTFRVGRSLTASIGRPAYNLVRGANIPCLSNCILTLDHPMSITAMRIFIWISALWVLVPLAMTGIIVYKEKAESRRQFSSRSRRARPGPPVSESDTRRETTTRTEVRSFHVDWCRQAEPAPAA